jgi:hypothetical protein
VEDSSQNSSTGDAQKIHRSLHKVCEYPWLSCSAAALGYDATRGGVQ